MAHRLQTTRIATDPHASPALRRLVNHARADLPDAATLSRLAGRLDTAIAAHVPAPELTVTSGASGSLGAKLLGAVLIAGIAIGGATYLVRGTAQPTARPRSSVSVENPPNTGPSEPLVATTPSVQSPTSPVIGTATTASAAEASIARRKPANRDGMTEAMLLDSARAKLRTDPKRAVELTREHARRFPDGALVQEREVIAIDALRRLGQDDAAKKRSEDFSQQYPDSAHQSKIDQTLKGN